MPVTIKELAKKLNISPATVSLALNDDARVAGKTREKIKRLAEKLDYVPNNFGRGLQSRRSRLVGYLCGSTTGSFFDLIIQGVGVTAAQNNYGLLTAITQSSQELEAQINIFLEKGVEGIITSYNYSNMKTYLPKIEKHKIPVVFCTSQDTAEYPHVLTDNTLGGRLAAQHLLALGHTEIACCGKDQHRLHGNLEAMKEAGVFNPPIFQKAQELPELMKNHPFTAVIAYSDAQAIRIKHTLEAKGIRVPEDVSLVGFDDMWFAALEEFSFTTVSQPKMQIGQESMLTLLDILKGGTHESKLLKPELIFRKSSIPLKK
jgi:DNA-binding LacI/PurR family transcriptional regulator